MDLLISTYGSRALAKEFGSEWEVFLREDVIETWTAAVYELEEMSVIKADDYLGNWLKSTETTVFEGAQGVLLDADKGFHPYTTWSDCTAANAAHLLDVYSPQAEVTRIGILRSHAVRHGPGPLPTESGQFSAFIHEHNQTNPWQREVRYGHFDAVLANYALKAAGCMDLLALTHLDLLQHLPDWKYCSGYDVSQVLADEFLFPNMTPGNDLERREQLTRVLCKAEPVYQNCAAEEGTVIGIIEELTGHKIGITAYGQTSQHVKFKGL
jgi:adenylosuccinate synthase